MAESERERRYIVAYALPPKKVESLILPSLLTHARDRGIDLIPVDLDKPLVLQPPFDCLVHKLYGDDWNRQLLDFSSKHPHVLIIDSPSAISLLHDRVSMLDVLNHVASMPMLPSSQSASLGVPRQVVVVNVNDNNFDLRFPLIAKPLLADGTANSHQMSLLFNSRGLNKVNPPVVLQEFVNHGGVLFKVYVAGDYVKCVHRRSLPDFHVSQAPNLDSLEFSQISNVAAQREDDNDIQEPEMPPLDFIVNLAKALREATKLHLFNFDLIRDTTATPANKYLVIDINYFPGYAKLPGFETMLTDFFWDVITHHKTNCCS